MIFLFFGTSLALLEAELAPFKDLEEIGNIWECKSSSSSSRLIKRNENSNPHPLVDKEQKANVANFFPIFKRG